MNSNISMSTDIAAALEHRARMDALLGGVAAETTYFLDYVDPDPGKSWRMTCKNRVVTTGLNQLLTAAFTSGLASPAWYIGLVGRSITDAAMTSGSGVLTSASNPFTAADATRAIIVRGAGASNADLVTTIATYTNAGSVTLAANAGTTVSAQSALWDARAADTMASHTPWNEITAYTQSTRPAWTGGSVSGGSVDNSASQAAFSINADNTLVGGLFLSNNNVVGGTTGTLYGMAPFGTPGFQQMNNGGTLNVTAQLQVTAA